MNLLSPLRVEKLGAQRWILIDNLVWTDRGWFVPRGFQTDLASIPRPLWAIFPPVDDYDAAAVFHDAAYEGAIIAMETEERIALTKEEGDKLFYTLLRALGISRLRAWLMYQAVKWFGNGPTV